MRFNVKSWRAWASHLLGRTLKSAKRNLHLTPLVLLCLWLLFRLLITEEMTQGWDRDTNRVVANYIKPGKTFNCRQRAAKHLLSISDSEILFPRILHSSASSSSSRYLVVVHSKIDNQEQRDTIRKTWMPNLEEAKRKRRRRRRKRRYAGLSAHFDIIFLTGVPPHQDKNDKMEQLKKESERHGDILVQDFVDSYLNLTVKSLMMIKFAYDHRDTLRYDYILKVLTLCL